MNRSGDSMQWWTEWRRTPWARGSTVATAWAMAAPGQAYLVYSMAGESVDLDLSGDTGSFTLAWLDSADGELHPAAAVAAGSTVTLAPPAGGAKRPWVAWLVRR